MERTSFSSPFIGVCNSNRLDREEESSRRYPKKETIISLEERKAAINYKRISYDHLIKQKMSITPELLQSTKSKHQKPRVFHLNGVNSNTEDLKPLSKAIKHFHSTRRLDLSLTNCHMSNKRLESISHELKHFVSLQSLRLRVIQENITDRGLRNLSQGLRHLISLQRIVLIFRYCRYVTNQGLKELSQGLKRLASLQSIELDFSGCTEANDEGVDFLMRGLKHHVFLRSLSIDFSGCYSITFRGWKCLSQVLKHFFSLRNISFCFYNCSNMKFAKWLIEIKQGLINLPELQSVFIGISGCDIDEEVVEKIRDDLKSIETIKRIKIW